MRILTSLHKHTQTYPERCAAVSCIHIRLSVYRAPSRVQSDEYLPPIVARSDPSTMLRAAWQTTKTVFSRRPPYGRLLAAELDFKTACPLLELNERIVAGLRAEADQKDAYHALRSKWQRADLAELVGELGVQA